MAINEYEDTIQQFNLYIKRARKEGNNSDAFYYDRNLAKYKKKQLIEFLAKNNVLPRYGFPVDTVELSSFNTSNSYENATLNLSRDLQIAISEYAPGSQIIANGQIYTSRYLKRILTKHKTQWEEGNISICDEPGCQTVNYKSLLNKNDKVYCTACGSLLRPSSWRKSIEPRSGFISEEVTKPATTKKPERLYRTEEFYLGDEYSKKIQRKKVYFDGTDVEIETTKNDSLIVKNTSDFYVCMNCGYTLNDNEINKDFRKGDTYQDPKKHTNASKYECKNQKLKLHSLHHIFKTDVIKITFSNTIDNRNLALSLLHALLDAIARVLEIERRDIRGTLHRSLNDTKGNQYSFIIYDSVAGGVGHTRRLMEDESTNGGELLRSVFENAYYDTKNCTCDPSCYSCLRNYGNQRIHEILNRHDVYNFLEAYISPVVKSEILELEEKKFQNFDFELVEDSFNPDIEDWDELMNYSSNKISEIYDYLKHIEFAFPEKVNGKMKFGKEQIINVECVWPEDKIIIIDNINDNLEQLLEVNKDWNIISNLKEMKEYITDGKNISNN